MKVPPGKRFRPTKRIISNDRIDRENFLSSEEGKILALRIRNAFFRVYNWFNNVGDDEYGSNKINYWDGGETESGIRESIWGKIAYNLNKRGILNAERFVFAQFSARTNKKLYPTHLLSPSAFDYYEKHCEFADRELNIRLRSDLNTFKEAFHILKDWRKIILDSSLEVSPLFRFVIAVEEQDSSLVEIVKKAARMQFMLDPIGYLETWGKIIPRSIFEQLLSDIERLWYAQ